MSTKSKFIPPRYKKSISCLLWNVQPTKGTHSKERYIELAGHSLRSYDGNLLLQGPGGGGYGEGPGSSRATDPRTKIV